jgi:hypothetical protein
MSRMLHVLHDPPDGTEMAKLAPADVQAFLNRKWLRASPLAASSTSTPSCAWRWLPRSAGAWSAATWPGPSTHHGSAAAKSHH